MSKQIFRLFVTPTKKCIVLMRYIVANIKTINSMDVVIKVTKLGGSVDASYTQKICKSANITRLPTLIAPDKTLIIGVEKITEMFESNIRRPARKQDTNVGATDDALTSEFWARTMQSTADDTDSDDDLGDFQKKMSAMKKSQPKHRKQAVEDSSSDDEPDDNDDTGGRDNVAPPDARQRVAAGGARPGAMTEEQMDQMMTNAFLDNAT